MITRDIRKSAFAIAALAATVVLVAIGLGLAVVGPSTSATTGPGTGSRQAAACDEPGVRLVRVPQAGMRPSLEPNDVVLVSVVSATDLRVGDLAAVSPPASWGGGPPRVERVVALAGQHVKLPGGHLVVDGGVRVEPYLAAGQATDAVGAVSSWLVPAGTVFVLGDNRSHSADSRSFGPLPVVAVLGRATYRCGPMDRRGPVE